MKTNWSRLLLCAALLVTSFLFCACEDEDEGFYLEYDTPYFSLTGDWTGSDDFGYVYSDLNLCDDDGYVSGSVLWPGGCWRNVSGYRTGTKISIRIDGGDEWVLYYDDDRLSGIGYGPDDDYDICFRRR